MPVYSAQYKEQLVRKLMPPSNQSVAQVSRDSGVSVPALYNWKKKFQDKGHVVPAKSSRPEGWDSKAKLAAIIQTAAMNEAQRAEYCREHGLYVEQLEAWKLAFEALDTSEQPSSKAELSAQRQKIRQLEKDLTRKDKALAETAALLVLSKKVQAIWGSKEED